MTDNLESLRARAQLFGFQIDHDEQHDEYKVVDTCRQPIEASGTLDDVEEFISYVETHESRFVLDELPKVYVPVSPETLVTLEQLVGHIRSKGGNAKHVDIQTALDALVSEACGTATAA